MSFFLPDLANNEGGHTEDVVRDSPMDISQTDDLNETWRPSPLEGLKQTMSEKIFSILVFLRTKKNVPYTTSVEMINFLQDFTATLFDQVATAFNLNVTSIVQNELVHSAVSVIVDKLENAYERKMHKDVVCKTPHVRGAKDCYY